MSEVPQIGNADLAHMIQKARTAAGGGFGVLSTGEKLIAALLLDRPDWLAKMDYTMADAIERVGADWLRLIPAAARQLRDEIRAAAYTDAIKAREAQLTGLAEDRATDDPAAFAATLVTWGDSPGYRDVDLVFDLEPAYQESSLPSFRASIRISPADGEAIVRHIRNVYRFAWGSGEPIDVKPGEKRPTWIWRRVWQQACGSPGSICASAPTNRTWRARSASSRRRGEGGITSPASTERRPPAPALTVQSCSA